MSRRVILIEKPKPNVNLSDLVSWGKPIYVFGPDDRRPSMFAVEEYMQELASALERIDFDPDADIICMTGNLIQVSFLLTAATQLYGQVALLMYHAGDCKYVRRIMTLKGLEDDRTVEDDVDDDAADAPGNVRFPQPTASGNKRQTTD